MYVRVFDAWLLEFFILNNGGREEGIECGLCCLDISL